MSEAKIKLIEDRVLRAVAEVRSLREARDRAEDELREVRRRLEELEAARLGVRHGLSPDRVGEVRDVLEAAIRELRDEAVPTTGPKDGAAGGETRI